MTKTSKKSFIAVVIALVVAVVCAVSAVTYAFFTDEVSGSGKVFTFGKVNIEITAETEKYAVARSAGDLAIVTNQVMPGDVIDVNATIHNINDAVWVRPIITATFSAAPTDKTALDLAFTTADWTVTTSGTVYTWTVDDEDVIAIAAAASDEDSLDFTINIPTGLLNEMATKTITFALLVEAIQQANFVPGTTAWPTIEGPVGA